MVKFFRYDSGQSLFEILFAILIISLIITAVVGLATVSIRNSVYAKNKTLATKYAQEAVEWCRLVRDKSNKLWAHGGRSGEPKIYCLQELTNVDAWNPGRPKPCGEQASPYITGTTFIRELSLLRIEEDSHKLINVKVTVQWNDAQGNHEVRVVTDFAKAWSEAI